MSTLDSVFIRAFSRESEAAPAAAREERPAVSDENVSHAFFLDESSPGGNQYRIDVAWGISAELVVPAPHGECSAMEIVQATYHPVPAPPTAAPPAPTSAIAVPTTVASPPMPATVSPSAMEPVRAPAVTVPAVDAPVPVHATVVSVASEPAPVQAPVAVAEIAPASVATAPAPMTISPVVIASVSAPAMVTQVVIAPVPAPAVVRPVAAVAVPAQGRSAEPNSSVAADVAPTDSAHLEPASPVSVATMPAAQPANDPPTKEARSLRLDAGAGQAPAPHARPTAAPQESHRRNVTLDPIAPQNRFTPVWEVDEFAWSDITSNMSQLADDVLQDAGAYLRTACREGLRVLAVTSSVRGEGRTTTALCLARSVAASGIRVAVLDADLENADVANQVGLEVTSGWEEVILGRLPLEEVAVHSLNDRITIIPLSPTRDPRQFELDDPRVTAMVREASQIFDLLVIDMGPIGSAARRMFETGDQCPLDASIIVRDLRLKPAESMHTIGARLRSAGVKSVGIIENFVTRARRIMASAR